MSHTLRARILSPVSSTEVTWIPDGVVTFGADGTLTEVAPYTGQSVDEDLRPAVLLPGFVDAHLHFPQTRIVGAATGPLLEWLAKSTFPEEQRFADPAHANHIADVFAACLAAAGTTLSMVYASVHLQAAHALFGALERRGLRAIAGPVLMDINSPEPLVIPPEPALAAIEELVERWHNPSGLLQVAVIPRFALSCSERMMRESGELAQRHGLWVTTHLSENLEECRVATEMFGTSDYLSVYEQAGMLHNRSVYAHCIHLSDNEWDRFAAAGAVVAHCPDSNFFLGSGRMPVADVLRRDIPIALGTDIAAGRSFRVPRIASSAYDNALATGHTLDPRTLLWWSTRAGALALQQPQVGALEVGLQADMVALDLPEWVDSEEEALAWALFDHDAPRPLRTWVAGQCVWRRSGSSYPWREPQG